MTRYASPLILLLTAGCLAPTDVQQPDDDGANAEWGFETLLPITECAPSFTGSVCFEPAVAVSSDGRAFAITGGGDRIVATDDRGATFHNVTPPGLPAGAGETYAPGDAMLHFDAQDRLYVHALLYDHARAAGQVLGGLQVARSDDYGVTWETNVLISAESNIDPTPFLSFVDRQWFATGDGDHAYLNFWSVGVGGFATHSSDAGATWSRITPIALTPTRRTVSIPGPVVVAQDGSLLVPFFSGNARGNDGQTGAAELTLAVSKDHGQTWTPRTAFSSAYPVEAGSWPVASVSEDGVWHIVWANRRSEVTSISSRDGTAWTKPIIWSEPDSYTPQAPFVVPDGVNLTVTWYSSSDYQQPMSLNFARGASFGDGSDIKRAEVTANLSGTQRLTDFAHHALYPNGDAFIPWIDGKSGLFLSFERRTST